MASFAKGTPGTSPNPYSDCGIGAALFPKSNIGAVISNVIWDLGLTAITSAVSSPETCNGERIKTAKLILQTLPELEQDVALGNGQYLAALNETIGCNSIAQNEVNSRLRASYASVVSDDTYSQKNQVQRASDMYNTVRSVTSSMESGSCKVAL